MWITCLSVNFLKSPQWQKVRNGHALNLYDHGIKDIRIARSCAIELRDDAVDKESSQVNAVVNAYGRRER